MVKLQHALGALAALERLLDRGRGADRRLHLLLAADRRYSSVAGLAPAGAATVRLSWRHGSPTEVPVTADSVAPAFVDNSGRPPLELVRAEALDASGIPWSWYGEALGMTQAGHQRHRAALAEAGARRPLRSGRDPLEHDPVHRFGREVAHHAPARDDVRKFHGVLE